MSQARISTVKRSRKPYKCEKCRDELPIGSAYRWFVVGFRSNYNHIRCMKTTCTPRASELESSNLSEAYSAQETAEDELKAQQSGDPGDTGDLESILSDFASSLEDLVSTYREADEGFGGGGMTVSGEIADTLENTVSDVQQWSADEYNEEWCEKHESEEFPYEDDKGTIDDIGALAEAREQCDDCKEKKREWWTEQIDAALEVVGEAQFS